MALRFQPYVSPETYLSYRDQNERPSFDQRVNQPLLRGIEAYAQGDQIRLARERQAKLDQILQSEEDRKRQEQEYKYGRTPDASTMIDQGETMGRSSFMPGGQGVVSQRTPMDEAINEFRSGGMKPEMARPEFMPFLGAEEKKTYQEQFDPVKQAQAKFYQSRAANAGTPKKYHFVDSTSHQMFDENMNPISLAPEGSTPKIIGNPYAGSEYARRDALSTGAINSVNRAKEILNDSTLTELKGIRFTPGKMYSQIASPEGKELYRNLYNAIANQLYLKTGATANPSEIENNMIAYMPSANDTTSDMFSRLDMLSGEAALFSNPGKGGGVPRNTTPKNNSFPSDNPSRKDAPLTPQERARLNELRNKRRLNGPQ